MVKGNSIGVSKGSFLVNYRRVAEGDTITIPVHATPRIGEMVWLRKQFYQVVMVEFNHSNPKRPKIAIYINLIKTEKEEPIHEDIPDTIPGFDDDGN